MRVGRFAPQDFSWNIGLGRPSWGVPKRMDEVVCKSLLDKGGSG